MKKLFIALSLMLLSMTANALYTVTDITPVGGFVMGQSVTKNLRDTNQNQEQVEAHLTIPTDGTYSFTITPGVGYNLSAVVISDSLGNFYNPALNGNVYTVDLLAGNVTVTQYATLTAKVVRTQLLQGTVTFTANFIPFVPYVAPPCSDSSFIAARYSKLFFVTANGNKVTYSNVYGKPGTTVFTYLNGVVYGTFPIGAPVTYSGILDGSGICVIDAITIG